MKKINLTQFIDKKEKILITLLAFIAVFSFSFDSLRTYGIDYAGYFGIATGLASIILLIELATKEDEELTLDAKIFYASIIAMVIILATVVSKAYTTQMQGVEGILLLFVPGIIVISTFNKLFQDILEDKSSEIQAAFLSVGILSVISMNKLFNLALLTIRANVSNEIVVMILSSAIGGLIFYFAAIVTLTSFGNLITNFKIKNLFLFWRRK